MNPVIYRELSVTGASFVNVLDWGDELFGIYISWLEENGLI